MSAVGVYNPNKPGETVWLFGYRDLEGLIQDDIYKYMAEVLEDADLEVAGLQAEVDEWQKWHDEHLEDDQRTFSDLLNELDDILNILSDRNKRLDRGDLISRFKELRQEVYQSF